MSSGRSPAQVASLLGQAHGFPDSMNQAHELARWRLRLRPLVSLAHRARTAIGCARRVSRGARSTIGGASRMSRG
jgi:hypothetical protein